MQTTSERFQSAIRSGGRRKTIVNVTEAFGTPLIFENIAITDGQIVVDRNSEIRRSGWIKIGEKSLTDVFFRNHSGPFGMEIHLYHGIVYPNGSEELVKMGVFNIDNFSWQEGDGGWPVVQIYDRSKMIQRAALESPKDYSGKFVQTVITEVAEEALPLVDVQFEVGLADPRLPGGSVFEGSRLEIIQTCCESMGAEFYFDPQGVLQVVSIPDPTATAEAAVWEFNVGEGFSEIQGIPGAETLVSRPEGILIGATRSVGRESTYNAVVVFGSAPSSTVGQPYAIAYDNDPGSPTYYNGPFGKSVKRTDNQLLTTTAQCADAAVAELKNNLGLARSIEFTAVGNPALEASDYVLFTFSDNVQEVHLLDSYDYPLGPGDFSGSTRTNPVRQTASVGIVKGVSVVEKEPSAPGKPVVTAVTNTTMDIKWSSSRPGTLPIKSYQVFYNGALKKTVASPTQVAVITGLTSGTSYRITVRAIDEAGIESNLSEATSKKTTGTTVADSPLTTYTDTFTANWSRSYTGSGVAATWHGTDCYQGVVDGGNGNYRSLIGFDDEKIRSKTSGADIVSCEVFLYFEHWYNNSGGTAVIGTHNYDNRPTTWSNSNVNQDRVRSSGWPKPGGRWVNLGETIGNNFRTGTAKGIALGPGPSSGHVYYGRALGSTEGNRTPVLRIKYRK